MDAVKPRDEMTRTEIVSLILRQCALLTDPRSGHLKSLADVIEVHEVTLSVWIRQGYVPLDKAKKLQEKFGKKHAPLNDLCPHEFRHA